jgi:hypothetical protein
MWNTELHMLYHNDNHCTDLRLSRSWGGQLCNSCKPVLSSQLLPDLISSSFMNIYHRLSAFTS